MSTSSTCSSAQLPQRTSLARVDNKWTAMVVIALGRALHVPLQALGRRAEEHTAELLAAREAYDAGSR